LPQRRRSAHEATIWAFKERAWQQIQAAVEKEQSELAGIVADIAAGRVQCKLSEAERFHLGLGITCHAVYHPGQIQLLKCLDGA